MHKPSGTSSLKLSSIRVISFLISGAVTPSLIGRAVRFLTSGVQLFCCWIERSGEYLLFIFCSFVQGRCYFLGKRSNSRSLDRQLFTFTVLREILMQQSHQCSTKVTIVSNKPGTIHRATNPSTARSLLLPVIDGVRSYLRDGFIISRHQMSQKDFF